MIIRRITAIAILMLVLAGAGVIIVRSKAPVNSNGLQVVAAENFWGDIARQLGGRYVHVTSIITNPTADPHLYESSARNAAEVSSANVVIMNGLGYDDFMGKLVGATTNPGRQVLNVQHILGVADGTNQHLWYDLPRINEVAAKITAAYVQNDPSHAALYRHNLSLFDQSLQPILGAIDQIKQRYSGTPIAYTEPVPAYILEDAGLNVQTPEGFAKAIENGDEPSPADTSAMDNLITGKVVRVLLYNAQATSPVTSHAEVLATQSGIPVVGITETLPNNLTYQTWQANQLHALQAALDKTS